MNARTSWSARAARMAGHDDELGDDRLPLDDLLDARFDDEGRLGQIGRGSRQRVAERLDPRPPALAAEELQRAVEKLARGLEAIERRSRAPAARERSASSRPQQPAARRPQGDDFVAHSLDRLEARLESLSRRLHGKTGRGPASPVRLSPEPAGSREEPPSMASSEPAPAELVSPAPASSPAPRGAQPRPARLEAALAEPFAALEARVEALLQSRDETQIEPVRRELLDVLRQIEDVRRDGRSVAETVGQVSGRLDQVEVKVNAARNLAGNRLGEIHDSLASLSDKLGAMEAAMETAMEAEIPALGAVRETQAELLDRFGAMQAQIPALGAMRETQEQLLDRFGAMQAQIPALGAMRESQEELIERFGAMQAEIPALGAMRDTQAALLDRFGAMQAEIPTLGAMRESQAELLERFGRVQDAVERIGSPQAVVERLEEIREQLGAAASRDEAARIEAQLLQLAERLDSLPEHLADKTVLERIDTQLQLVASELSEARRKQEFGSHELHARLSDLYAGLKEVGETARPDLSQVDERLADIAARLDDERRFDSGALERLDERLAALAAAVERQEDAAAAEVLAGLTSRMDALAEAIGTQQEGGSREAQGLERKLDQLARAVSEQAERLPALDTHPLAERLDQMQARLDDLAERAHHSNSQLAPFAEKLEDIARRLGSLSDLALAEGERTGPIATRLAAIEERLAGLAFKGADARVLQSQLEGIVSRLELLKGRSIDPARLAELFDRVDAVMNAGAAAQRFDRIEEKLDAAAGSRDDAERFERLEQMLDAAAGSRDDAVRFERLEQKLDAAAGPRDDAVRFERLEQKLDAVAGSRDDVVRFERLEQKLDAAAGSRDDAVRFERLEQKLEDIARLRGDEGITDGDIAELRSDIVALRGELRALPGLGEGVGSLGALLKSLSAQLQALPEERPATTIDLERQVERIAELLEDPAHNRLALAHIESSLKALEQRLEARPPSYDSDVDDAETVAGLARSWSEDVTVLRGATETSERRTREALEAVQGTLEAVVKRMAFLERDAERDAERDVVRADVAEPPMLRRRAASPHEEVDEEADEPAFAPGRLARADRDDAAYEAEPLPVMAAELPSLAAPAEELPPVAARLEPPRESPSLLSRLTSSQLLKRATGGRADSFSPEPEEVEESPDLPLEPGTDLPLDSALADAPSSDTARLSGRGRGRLDSRLADIDLGRTRRPASAPAGDDFLAAARRAAQAAAAEVAEAERHAEVTRQRSGLQRALDAMKSRRRIVLASALIVAAAFAALQLMRETMPAGDTPAEVVATLPQEPAAPAAIVAPPPAPPAEVAVAPSPEAQPPAPAPQAALPPSPPEQASPAASPAAPASTQQAAVAPSAPLPATPAPAPVAPPADLPPAVGPERLQQSAMAGDPAAAFEVAARYAEGRGIAPDLPAAVRWYEQAAAAGLAPAQYRLGSIYEKGMGAPKNLAIAQDWYRRAAEAGNVKAMHNLAVLHAEGAGGAPDLERASELFLQAAQHGVRDSQFNLAILYARGLGVPQDMVEAYKWFAVAASSGDQEALKRRDIIAAALPEADLARAQAAAESFQPLPLVPEANDVTAPEGGWGEEPLSSTALPADAVSANAPASGELPSENDVVALVQKLLTDHGFDPGPADGLLGRQTIQAITAFQQQAGLPATGQIDPSLLDKLRDRAT
jgi:localization factor PodJL